MVSMFTLWVGNPQIDTQSGIFNSNHYFNGLRHVHATWWLKLALNAMLATAKLGAIHPVPFSSGI